MRNRPIGSVGRPAITLVTSTITEAAAIVVDLAHATEMHGVQRGRGQRRSGKPYGRFKANPTRSIQNAKSRAFLLLCTERGVENNVQRQPGMQVSADDLQRTPRRMVACQGQVAEENEIGRPVVRFGVADQSRRSIAAGGAEQGRRLKRPARRGFGTGFFRTVRTTAISAGSGWGGVGCLKGEKVCEEGSAISGGGGQKQLSGVSLWRCRRYGAGCTRYLPIRRWRAGRRSVRVAVRLRAATSSVPCPAAAGSLQIEQSQGDCHCGRAKSREAIGPCGALQGGLKNGSPGSGRCLDVQALEVGRRRAREGWFKETHGSAGSVGRMTGGSRRAGPLPRVGKKPCSITSRPVRSDQTGPRNGGVARLEDQKRRRDRV